MPLAETLKKTRRLCFRRVLWTFLQEIFIGALLTVVTVVSLNRLVIPLLKTVGKILTSYVSRFWPSFSPIVHSHYSSIPQLHFFAEAVYLWLAAIVVVVFASVLHRRWSTQERDELNERVQQQKSLREKHFT